MSLPININDLLHGKSVEWERLEFKAGWNPLDVLHSICAFANDFHNLGGGYIVVGVAEKDGRPEMPPVGLNPASFDAVQKEILSLGYSSIQPAYHPIVAPCIIEGASILVIWVPGGQTRPYKANRRIGEFLKELSLTEGRSTGIPKILRAMAANGSPPPDFETDEDHSYFQVRLPAHPLAQTAIAKVSTGETAAGTKSGPSRDQVAILLKCLIESPIQDLMELAQRTNRTKFRDQVLKPLLADGLLAMTIPDKPTSRNQRYIITDQGRALLTTLPEDQP